MYICKVLNLEMLLHKLRSHASIVKEVIDWLLVNSSLLQVT